MESKEDYSSKPLPTTCPESDSPVIRKTIPQEYSGQRLDQALAQLLPDWSRSRIQTWITNGRVKLDDKNCQAKQKIWGGEQVSVQPDTTTVENHYAAEAISLNILFEDEQLIIINKPAGMVVHPGNGNWQGTLLNALLHHSPQLENVPRAGIVHRLDKDTTGLMVVTKTIEAQTSLVRQLQQRTVKREYLAVTLGEVAGSGVVDAPIGRHPAQRTKMAVNAQGKPARTHYKVLERFSGCSLVQCNLETGRTHQIRVHMHSIGHPLAGDPVYGGKPKKITPEINMLLNTFPRQALHAWKLALIHPLNSQSLQWQSELPGDMIQLLHQLKLHTTQAIHNNNYKS